MTTRPVKKELGCFIVQRRVYQVPAAFLVLRETAGLWQTQVCPKQETLYDKAMTLQAAKLEHVAGTVPETVDEDVYMSSEDKGPALLMGWALKSAIVTRKNLTDAKKIYLTEVFREGERSGKKADPINISKAIRRAKYSEGSRIFEKEEFLTIQKIAGVLFFSPL